MGQLCETAVALVQVSCPDLVRSERERTHQPGRQDRKQHEGAEEIKKVLHSLRRTVFRDEAEDKGDQEAEKRHEDEVVSHCFLPIAISNTSTITSMFKRPAT